tara:strand:- start:2242 stop:3258 length:1017 start_codon:yes stop_codon:yes gene_type:complete
LNYIRNNLYKIKKRILSKTIILCYHRVCDFLSDPYDISINKENFIKQINWIKEKYNIIDLDELSLCFKNDRFPARKSIILTFDDGYYSTIDTIRLLEELEVPATFFICTPNFKSNYFYWDILNNILIENKVINDDQIKWIMQLGQIINLDFKPEKIIDNDKYQKGLLWKINDSDIPSKRCQILKKISEVLEFENPYLPSSLLKRIYDNNFNISTDKQIKPNLSMLKSNYCDIGGHTMNHFSLSSLDNKMINKEILYNKNELENQLDHRIKYFAYPFGSKRHYNQYSVKIVKENFKLAVSNFPGVIYKDSNPYELPRCLVRNWEINFFKNKINNFFANK